MSFDAASLKSQITDLAAAVATLQGQVQAKKQEREDIINAPLARSDVAAFVGELFDRAGVEYPRRLSESLAGRITNADLTLPPDNFYVRQSLSNNLAALHNHPQNFKAEAIDLEFGLMALLGDTLKTPILATIAVMDWPGTPGLTLAARTTQVAALNAEIAALEADLAGLMTIADASGVSLHGVHMG